MYAASRVEWTLPTGAAAVEHLNTVGAKGWLSAA
jgi:hypothetical protein